MKNNAATKPVKPVKITRPADREIFGTWTRGYEAGDVTQIMSIFSDDLRYITPCEPEQTFESLSNWYKFDFARKGPRPTWTFRTESIDVGGDLAVIVSRWMAITNYPGFQADVYQLRSIDFLRFGENRLENFPHDQRSVALLRRAESPESEKSAQEKIASRHRSLDLGRSAVANCLHSFYTQFRPSLIDKVGRSVDCLRAPSGGSAALGHGERHGD